MSTPRNIVRIDIDHRNTHGWQVRVTRHGERHTKFFSDSRFDGSDGALAEAEAYRDHLIEVLPEPLDGTARSIQARSTSGVPGIRLGFNDGIPTIEADAVSDEGQRKVRRFSLKKWGLRRALWKACVWKSEFLEIRGTEGTQELYQTAYKNISKQLEEEGIETAPPEEEEEALQEEAMEEALEDATH